MTKLQQLIIHPRHPLKMPLANHATIELFKKNMPPNVGVHVVFGNELKTFMHLAVESGNFMQVRGLVDLFDFDVNRPTVKDYPSLLDLVLSQSP